MNERTSALLSEYKPRLAIVAYVADGNEALGQWSDAYLESHVINERGELAEGKPLMQETITGIVDVFFNDQQNRAHIEGMIPPNVLGYELLPGGYCNMIWYQPAQLKQIFFSESLHIPSGKAWVPALIYQVYRKELTVFAIKDDKRPTEKTPLFRAPFHNIDTDGKVCLGSAKVKKPTTQTYDSVMKYWEDLFWLSEFSHLHGSTNPTKTNLTLIWKRLLKNNKLNWSKLEEFKSAKRTLKSLFE